MKNLMPRARAVWACVLLLAAGCTSRMPWEHDWGQSTSCTSFVGQDPNSLVSTPSRPSARSSYRERPRIHDPTAWASTPSQGGVTLPSQNATPSDLPNANPLIAASHSVTSAFKSVGDMVSSALEVNPKMIPAADPAKLYSRPDHLTPAVYIEAAQLAESQGAIAEARQQYEKALVLNPRDVTALIAFARRAVGQFDR